MEKSQSTTRTKPADTARPGSGTQHDARSRTADSARNPKGSPADRETASPVQAQQKNRLLSITNLKKYFPVAKSSFFAKQMYVRANEDISIDIYQGETFGLVGESGCG